MRQVICDGCGKSTRPALCEGIYLSECPFCGKGIREAIQDGGQFWYVRCNGCFARGPFSLKRDEAIDNWNARTVTNRRECADCRIVADMQSKTQIDERARILGLVEQMKTGIVEGREPR